MWDAAVSDTATGALKRMKSPVLGEHICKLTKDRNTWKNIISRRKSVVYLRQICDRIGTQSVNSPSNYKVTEG